MVVLTVALSLLACLVMLPTISELWSFLRVSPFRPRMLPAETTEPLPDLLFLVPAHNEEALVTSCLNSLAAQEYPSHRRHVVVIADNCTDRTAELARASGVDVLVRTDQTKRGKPWAISWALNQLDLSRHDGVVIMDADSEVSSNFATELASHAPLSGKVLQPYIGVRNPKESPLTRMAAVYSRAVHGLAYRMKEKAGLNVPLGAGMCIGTDVLQTHGWSAFTIGEDRELYGILTAKGVSIAPVEGAVITAQEASNLRQSGSQRHRWTAGQRQALVRCAKDLLTSRHISLAQRFDAVAELAWFGPVVTFWFASVGATLAFLLAPPGGTILGALLVISLLRPIAYAVLALIRDPEPLTALRAFGYLPVYFLWRIGPAIRSLLPLKQEVWVRTDRGGSGEIRS